MKKIRCLLPLFLIPLFSNCILSQETNKTVSSSKSKGFYVDIKVGYAYKMNSQNLANSFEMYNVTMNNGNEHFESIFISLGQGFNAEAAFGYMFNKHVGADLGISYLWGSTFEAKRQTEMSNIKYTLSSNMLRFSPSIVIRAGFDKFDPYAKFGCVFGLGKVFYTDDDFNYGQSGESEYEGGMAFGINAAAGVIFKLNDKLSLFGEINTINMSYSPTKSTLTKATENGADILPNLHVYNKEVEYVDSYDREPYDPNNPEPDYTKPRQELKFALPFGSIGLNIGLKINF
nr:outer membrane beta-barrel protein [Bacteroidota bacterium]